MVHTEVLLSALRRPCPLLKSNLTCMQSCPVCMIKHDVALIYNPHRSKQNITGRGLTTTDQPSRSPPHVPAITFIRRTVQHGLGPGGLRKTYILTCTVTPTTGSINPPFTTEFDRLHAGRRTNSRERCPSDLALSLPELPPFRTIPPRAIPRTGTSPRPGLSDVQGHCDFEPI